MMHQLIENLYNALSPLWTELAYNPNKPILFTQLFFWEFFLVIILIYSALYKNIKLRNTFLFIVSIYFYYKCSGWFVFMLLFAIVANFYIGNGIYRSTRSGLKKFLVFLSVFISMSLLSYFKYTYFFTNLFNSLFGTKYAVIDYLSLWTNSILGTGFDIRTILLPAGISFFSFHALSYTIDIYRGKTAPAKNIPDFGFYLAFFPQLVAGPIIRASDFIPQIYKQYQVSKREMGIALFLILGGLVKKMVISDFISLNFVDRIFDSPLSYSGAENLLGVYGYSLQIYCDFSGYTDIAIGLALLFGFRIPVNFNSPYKATSLTDFWHRWHISLSSWLRDYLYISMGGNRGASFFTYFTLGLILLLVSFIWKPLILIPLFILIIWIISLLFKVFPDLKRTVNTSLNLMITMLVGGLWHGANWRFVIWGAIHGVGLVIDKLKPKVFRFNNASFAGRFISILITFHIVTLAWIFFRAADISIVKQIFNQISNHFHAGLILQIIGSYWKVFTLIISGLVLHWLPSTWKSYMREKFIMSPAYAKVLVTLMIVLFIFQFKSSVIQPFIYFQF